MNRGMRMVIVTAMALAAIGLPEFASGQRAWRNETIDAGLYYFRMTNRSCAVDSQGRLHVAYGYQSLYHAWFDGASWQKEKVDTDELVGSYASLAIDGSDGIHVSYYDDTNDRLKYAKKVGGNWTIEVVDDSGTASIGEFACLSLDSLGKPHVAYGYIDASITRLRYASKPSTSWVVQNVDSGVDTGSHVSIDMDSQLRPHISYVTMISPEIYLKYARHTGSGWVIETVDSGAGHHSSIILDTSDRPHISYTGDDPENLRYAYWTGSTWTKDVIDTYSGWGTSIALDGAGKPQIASCNGTVLTVATNAGGNWTTETVEALTATSPSLIVLPSGVRHLTYSASNRLTQAVNQGAGWEIRIIDRMKDVGLGNAIALAGGTLPRITYRSTAYTFGMLYAEFNNGLWQVQTVAEVDGDYSSLVVDRAGNPHVCFDDDTNGGLKYAKRTSGTWSISTVETGTNNGDDCSLVLDKTGNPHVCYYDNSSNRKLKYARFNGTAWVIENITSYSGWGNFVSLVLDGSDTPHVAYFYSTTSDLRYAVRTAKAWSTQSVDTTGSVGRYCSLMLDNGGNPHISYYDYTNAEMKYAYWMGSGWDFSVVDDASFAGEGTSLALDATGKPRIAYFKASSSQGEAELRYAALEQSGWSIQTVIMSGGREPSLVLDTQGNAHLSSYDPRDKAIVYSTTAAATVVPLGPLSLSVLLLGFPLLMRRKRKR